MTEKIPPKEITLKVDYIRTFPCGLCKEPLTASKIPDGWILNCGCFMIFRKQIDVWNENTWTKVE